MRHFTFFTAVTAATAAWVATSDERFAAMAAIVCALWAVVTKED